MELTLKNFANQIVILESHVQSFWEQELVLYQLEHTRKMHYLPYPLCN